ncbi:MAG: DUF1615 domain-containing protein [Pseudomonadota bacterium]|nr:DUF1615 domain-containing protein [Pseudomonadota bacterium]
MAGKVRGRGGLRGWLAACTVACTALVLAGCASEPPAPAAPALTPAQARALIVRLLPATASDRTGWATDIYAAFAVQRIAPTQDNVCAVIAVTAQESTFSADPVVPGLPAIAWREIDKRAERAGVPRLVVHGALQLMSPNGRSYSDRIDGVKSEKDLSDIFQDFIGIVPMGKRLFAGWNPVHTAGPMQVSVTFAEQHAAAKPYPYPLTGSIRDEVFTRRGGLYFGIAHLLGYPAAYDRYLYRFADFNAGQYASRNAAFQSAVSSASGVPLALDGDLLAYDNVKAVGSTELAVRVLATRLDLGDAAIHRALEQGKSRDFESTSLYRRVYGLAEQTEGHALPRAVVPRIQLQSPKITRSLTTEWFANRVDERFRRCLSQ